MIAAAGQSTSRFGLGIRAKLVFAFLLACAPMVLLVGWFGLETVSNLMRAQAIRNMRDATRLGSRRLEDIVFRGTADARYLSRTDDVHRLGLACASGEPPAELVRHVQLQFGALGESVGGYAAIRYIEASGRERVRVEFPAGRSRLVPAAELETLGGRPLFESALRLPAGATFVSPLDLDRRDGKLVQPPRPVLRFVAPVVQGSRALGLVSLSADVGPALPKAAYEAGNTFLCDLRGFYLSHTDPQKAWSGPRNRGTGHNLLLDYGPQAAMALQPAGAVIPIPGHTLVTYPILLGAPAQGNWVILGVESTDEVVFARLADYRRFFWGVVAISFLAPILAGLSLASFFLRPVGRLRAAVHAVAEGDLDTTLRVRSGDEFQVLADDFNTMASRLREYQQQERLALIGRMAATIIHDLRNPLASLSVSTKLLADRDLPPEQRREVGRRAQSQTERILTMLQEILEFSRTGRTEIHKQPVDLRQLLAEMEYGLQTQCGTRGITLVFEQQADCVISADRDKLHRALANIATNACEAMDAGGTVTIRSECDPDYVTLRIADTGPGIPGELLGRLFEPFVTQGKTTGTGLGLAIAHAVAEAHGGTLTAENRPEGGAQFTLKLPLNGA